MALIDVLIGPVASIIDKIISDKEAQARAKLELIALQGTQEMQMLEMQLKAIVAEANSADPWTNRARPSFLYVMYILLLAALPMGLLSAFNPVAASDIAAGMNGLSHRPARTALRPLRHRLPRLHRRTPVG